MVKSGTDRAAKYAAKYDPTVVSTRYTATKDMAVAAQNVHQAALGTLAGQVRGIMNSAGVAPINSVRFIAYGNKLYGIANKFQGVTGTSEATAASIAWVAKIAATKFDKAVMIQIWNLFSSQFGNAPSPFPSA